ncbi:MAG TPA: 30S ribosomal protein S1 [Acidobacteriaceae bacterium]|nr:30S ribosomal protein S1 [Acidobacteriaceae bacterium]
MNHENFPSPAEPFEEKPSIDAESASERAAEVSSALEAAVPEPPETQPEEPARPQAEAEPAESFAEMLSEFEHGHHAPTESRQVEATVVSVAADTVYLDIGFKVEGVLPRAAFENNADEVKAGDRVHVSVKQRNAEGYYELSRFRVKQPTDWASLEAAFAEKATIAGTVTGVVKGGLTVDVGVRAFLPGSRSGARDAKEMGELVGQSIEVRITKVDAADEDVVVDRRAVLEEQALAAQASRWSAMAAGEVLEGKVRSLMSYGAFVDLGGIDGLLHISDIAWSRVEKPEDVLTLGQDVRVKVLKIDAETRRISLGMKQLEPEPWEKAGEKYKAGDRVRGTVTRLTDFGAFVELEPGIEGLIHVSEMSWVKKIHKPSDVLKPGDGVEAVILGVQPGERRMSLGLKQTLGDPWADAARKYAAGSAVEGPVTRLMKFGAFVQVAEGVEGLVHISEIVADRRLNHPSDVLKAGQVVRAQVLGMDAEKRQMKLSMKQLVPTSLDEYVAEHKVGDVVSGRVVEEGSGRAVVELGQGIRATCAVGAGGAGEPSEKKGPEKADLSALTNMLQARWKSGGAGSAKTEPLKAGQVRSFRIVGMEGEIRVEMA